MGIRSFINGQMVLFAVNILRNYLSILLKGKNISLGKDIIIIVRYHSEDGIFTGNVFIVWVFRINFLL